MKVLLVAERYWPEVGAAPSRLANMAEGLKKQGCEVDVLTSLPNYPKGRIFDGYRGCVSKKEARKGVEVFRYWIYATVSRNPVARILNMFSFAVTIWLFAFKRRRIKNYDVVIIQTPTLVVAASAMCLFKGLYGKRCVLNVSDIWPLTAVDMGAMQKGSRSYRFMECLERYLYRRADGVLGQSEEILNHVCVKSEGRSQREEGRSKKEEGRGKKLEGRRKKSEVRWKKLEVRGGGMDDPDSEEVLGSKIWQEDKRLFLYRNLQTYQMDCDHKSKDVVLRLVFSGMLGVAQDVAGIVKNVPWKELGVEFHILGGGKQYDEIVAYCKEHPDCGVTAYGFVPKEEIADRLKCMHASIVPLATRIRGAFPSKVFDILPQGLPILFCGGGEGARFVAEHGVGFTSAPGDYDALTENIKRMRDMTETEYETMSGRCIAVSHEELDFDKQMREVYEWMEEGRGMKEEVRG